jgi:hypothetical protein
MLKVATVTKTNCWCCCWCCCCCWSSFVPYVELAAVTAQRGRPRAELVLASQGQLHKGSFKSMESGSKYHILSSQYLRSGRGKDEVVELFRYQWPSRNSRGCWGRRRYLDLTAACGSTGGTQGLELACSSGNRRLRIVKRLGVGRDQV